MTYHVEKTLPSISERTLPIVTIPKITLSRGIPSDQQDVYLDADGQPTELPASTSEDTEGVPLEVIVDLACKDLVCSNENSLLINNKYKKFIKIHVVERFEGFEKETIYGVDSGFNLTDMVDNGGEYHLRHQTSYPRLFPQNLSFLAWIELDIAEYTNQLEMEGVNLIVDSEEQKFTGLLNLVPVIENSDVRFYISYESSSTYESRHTHHVAQDGSAGFTRTQPGTRRGGLQYIDGVSYSHQHTIDADGSFSSETPIATDGSTLETHTHNLIPETYIIDNRELEMLADIHKQAMTEDTSPCPATKTKKMIENPYKDTFNRCDPYNLFSDIYFSRDDDGDLRFLFFANMRRIMEKFSLFSSIFSNSFSYETILKSFPPQILSLKVYRQRVKKEGDQWIKSDPDQIDELVVAANQKLGSPTLNPVKHSNDSQPESIRGCSIEQKRLNMDMSGFLGVQCFSGIDATIKSKTDGYYQYRVELHVLDITEQIFESHIKSLNISMLSLREYYNTAINFPSEIKNPYGDPHKNDTDDYAKNQKSKSSKKSERKPRSGKKQHEEDTGGFSNEQVVRSENKKGKRSKQYVRGEYVPRNFNVLKNKFSDSFSYGSDWNAAKFLNDYFEVLSFYSSESIDFISKYKALANIISPHCGSPEGILAVIKLISALQNKISSFAALYKGLKSKDDDAGEADVNKSHIEGGDRKKLTIFHVRHQFKTTYDSNIPFDVGFNFLNLANGDKLGLKQVSRSEFEEIISAENKKLFNNENADLSIGNVTKGDSVFTSMYSYVTPTKISISSVAKWGSVNLKNPGVIAFFGDFKNLGKSIKYLNTNLNNEILGKSYAMTLMNEATNNVTNPKFSNNNKPMNKSEKQKIIDCLGLDDDIDFANSTSEYFGLNKNVVVVNEDADATPKKPQEKSVKSSDDDNDNTEKYVDNDLGKGKTSEQNRIAKPIFDDLLGLDIDSLCCNIDNFNVGLCETNIKKKVIASKSNQTPSSIFRSLPNSVKLLFKFNENGFSAEQATALRKDVICFLEKNPCKDDEDTFRYKFGTIDIIEVLTNFDTTRKKLKDGTTLDDFQLGMPAWKPVTKSLLNQTSGKNLLCRLTPYENSAVNIKRSKDYELPTYDEYFILMGS